MHTLTISVQDDVYQQVLSFLDRFTHEEVLVIESSYKSNFDAYRLKHPTISEETYFQLVAMDQSGFAQQVLNTAEEDRWNDCL